MSSMRKFTHILQARRHPGWQNSMIKSGVLLFIMLAANFASILETWAYPLVQQNTSQDPAAQLLTRLSPEERVGQLFLVTFAGTDAGEGTPVYDLIREQHIGGVVLLAANDNFTSEPQALESLQTMIRQMHLTRWTASQGSSAGGAADQPDAIDFIPLLIGTSQEGDGYPNDQILYGLTKLPNQMALGATWQPPLVEKLANVLGTELSAIGINLLLGPALDVLESPEPDSSSDLGTRAFGGDPYWVGKLGSAFVRGVHAGSQGKVAVIAKHFPGNGGADRPPEEEVATVRKSLEELKKFDLAPFFAVTGDAAEPASAVDGLLASHIRYQGFQENIRVTTRPVSFDPQAFSILMGLPSLATWRQAGGLMLSDNLGSRAVRRFYELTGQPFEARRVALNAFLAGNDLLYMGEMSDGEEIDTYTAIVQTLEFFSQKYREDPVFAARVDESVLRILRLKYRLYPQFILEDVLPSAEGLSILGTQSQMTFEIAQQAATLISPSAAEYDTALPDPPDQLDRLVFITDSREAQQCRQCPAEYLLAPDALMQAVIRLYGPQAGRQVVTPNLSAHTYQDLIEMMDSNPGTTQIERDLRRANWVVFAILDVSEKVPTSQALHRFLDERPDLLQQKRLVVFSFNAPYYLDATDISKINAYFGLYSHTPGFIDVAARLLFRELRPLGSLPVSVPGIGYDLITATSPNPLQVIPLLLDLPAEEQPLPTASPQPAPISDYKVGSAIPVRTGVIQDHNGRQVPDGTPVQFIITVNGELAVVPSVVTTRDGIARTSIQVSTSGILEVRVESEPAKQSDTLRFEIPIDNAPPPTQTLTPEPTAEPTPAPTATQVVIAPPALLPPERLQPELLDWIMSLLVVCMLGLIAYRLVSLAGYVRWGVRAGFMAVIGGLAAYIYLALQLPGASEMLERSGAGAILATAASGSAAGLLVTWAWRYLQARQSTPRERTLNEPE